MKWTCSARVTMQELDARLSRIVEQAREEPVAVNRYGSPWVWIVSHPLWTRVDNLQLFVPRNHPLVPLRESIESALCYEDALLADLARRCESKVGISVLFKCLVLKFAYSLENEEKVYEVLGYNMLFRWFAGFQRLADELPPASALVRDLRTISVQPRAIELIHNCLSNSFVMDADAGEFRINRGLLHTLRTYHVEVPPAHENQDGAGLPVQEALRQPGL